MVQCHTVCFISLWWTGCWVFPNKPTIPMGHRLMPQGWVSMWSWTDAHVLIKVSGTSSFSATIPVHILMKMLRPSSCLTQSLQVTLDQTVLFSVTSPLRIILILLGSAIWVTFCTLYFIYLPLFSSGRELWLGRDLCFSILSRFGFRCFAQSFQKATEFWIGANLSSRANSLD